MDRQLLQGLASQTIDWTSRAWPTSAHGVPGNRLREANLNILDGHFSYPVMVIKESALHNNVKWMSEFCRHHDVELAPHAKTAMAPQLVAAQLDAGAWGITVATIPQAQIFRRFGIDRMIVANQIVTASDLQWLVNEARAYPRSTMLTLVDSVEQVHRSDILVGAANADTLKLPVLLEVGYHQGRAGAQELGSALDVARAVAASRHFELVGLEGFEGVMPGDGRLHQGPAIETYLNQVKEIHAALRSEDLLPSPSLVSFGGSAYFDVVVAQFDRTWRRDVDSAVILRSGCYVSHDDGMYARLAPATGLRAALEVIATVTSCPERGRVIAGFGKRDVPHDAGLPTVKAISRDGVALDVTDVLVEGLNDHHAFLSDPHGTLRVGDLLHVGISHPCMAFDKWTLIPVVDESYAVTGAVRTFF